MFGKKKSDAKRADALRLQRMGGEEKKPDHSYEPVRLQTRKDMPGANSGAAKRRRSGGISTRWFSGILALITGGLAAAYSYLPQYRVTEPLVTGMRSINMDEISYYAGIYGQPIYMIDPDGIEENLERRYPEIRNATVTITMPNVVQIELEQRVPAIEWSFGGSRFWIEADGTVLNESTSQASTIQVLANSFPGAKDAGDRDTPEMFSEGVVRSVRNISAYVPEGKTLYYTYEHGFGWDTEEGWRVFVGRDDTDLDEKMRMHEALKDYFITEEIRPAILSLEYKDAPYYRYKE